MIASPRPHPWSFARFLMLPLVTVFAFCAFLLLRTAHAAPPPSSVLEVRTVEIEILDQAKDKSSETVRFTFSLTDSGRQAALQVPIGALAYAVNVRCEPSNTTSVPVTLTVKRRDSRPGSPADIALEVSTLVAKNAHTSVGTIQRPDGSKTEVLVKVR